MTELGVTYLPFVLSSGASYADLPLTLLGAPVSIGALLKPGSRSLGKAKTETGRTDRPPGTGPNMYPFDNKTIDQIFFTIKYF